MSLFSRLEERMRARDSQDDSNEKQSASADDGKGGLFGSIQLKPAQNEAAVPPPANKEDKAGMTVPSLEEARAELDRIRAQNAQNAQSGQSSGLFRRDKSPEQQDARETPRASNPARADRENVSFGAVSLPPRATEESPAPVPSPPEAPAQMEPSLTESVQTTFVPTSSPVQTPFVQQAENVPAVEKPFRTPLLSQFAEAEAAPAQSMAPTAPAPDAATPPPSNSEPTVYAPTASDADAREREVIARTSVQVVAPQDIVETVETLRATEIEAEPEARLSPSAAAEPEAKTEAEAEPAVEVAPEPAPIERAEEKPALRPANSSNMTPFQRLMAARAAQSGPPVSRPRNERPAPVASAPLPASLEIPQMEIPQVVEVDAEIPQMETSQIEVDAEIPQTEIPQMETPQVEADAEVPQMEVPQAEVDAEVPQIAVSQVEMDAEIPQMETPQVEVDAETPQVEVDAEVPQMETPQVEVDAETPQTETSQVEMEEELPLAPTVSIPNPDVFAPALSNSISAPKVEIETPEVELPDMRGPQIEVPSLETPPLPNFSPDVAGMSASVEPFELPQSTLEQNEDDGVPPLIESGGLYPDLSADLSARPEPQTEAPSPSEMETMASKADALIAQAREKKTFATESDDDESAASLESQGGEAEIVPEEVSTAMASTGAESSPEMPNSETVEPAVRPVLSLSERLARTSRDELDAAHAEAEALTPEILENHAPAREVAPPRAAPLSFAERLAARNLPKNEAPPASATSPVEPSFTPPAPQPAPQNLPQNSGDSSDSGEGSAPRPAPRSASRSFTERLAARTTLDDHLQVPAPESAPVSQDLAMQGGELARINEGAELSEREMKNRVLFRQKHLIFDAVIGSLDQRTMQNPTRETVKPQIESGVDSALAEYGLDLEQSERNWLVDEFVRETTDLGALVPMLEDPSVSKIVVTGAKDVSVERLGRIERTGVSFRDDDHLLNLVRRIAEMSGGRVDAKVPLLDRPLPDGGRIRAKVPPLAPQPTLTIEKSTGNPFVVLKRQMDEKSRGDSLPYAQLRERIQQRLLREFEGDAAALAGDQDKLRSQVEEMIGSVIAEEHVVVTRAERASLTMDLLNEIVGLGPIEPLLNDPDIDEVMVNGPYQIYVERKGKLELTNQRFRDNGHVMQVIDRIVAPLGRRVDEKSPMVDGRLRDGSRFNAIIPPLALSGPTMTIRKFARDPFTMSDLINFGTITRESAQFLQAAVEGRLNIVVSGGTGSGKTTTLNVLSSFIPSTERIVTIEDAAELQMRQEHVIRMETRPPNIEGVGEVSIRDLVKNSLRMRPDRIVVGECRGGEALDMLQAMNTGHDGSLTTAHSNGPRDTCKRLETMVMMAGFDLPVRAIREQISMAVQLVVHQERMRDGKRRVTAVTEIVGMEGDVLTLQDIFRFEQEGMDDDGRIIGSLQATGMRPRYYETIVDNGGTISMDIFSPKAHEAAPRAKLQERGGR